MTYTAPTVQRYLDLLSATFMVRQLPAWYENIGKRQVKSPKVYFRDSGLLHALLDLGSSRSIETHGTVSRASDGAVLAEADAVFLLMPDERRRELERRYSRTDETFARVRAAVAAEEGVREHGRT